MRSFAKRSILDVRKWLPLTWFSGGLRPVPVAVALAMASLAVAVLAPRQNRLEGPSRVELTALRGSGSGVIGTTPAGRGLILTLDAKALTGSAYDVSLSDGRGRELWHSSSPRPVEGAALHAAIHQPIPAGLYWVRLHDPGSGRLAREYGLRVR